MHSVGKMLQMTQTLTNQQDLEDIWKVTLPLVCTSEARAGTGAGAGRAGLIRLGNKEKYRLNNNNNANQSISFVCSRRLTMRLCKK